MWRFLALFEASIMYHLPLFSFLCHLSYSAHLADVTGAGNNREIPRLYKPIPHRERWCEYAAYMLFYTLPSSIIILAWYLVTAFLIPRRLSGYTFATSRSETHADLCFVFRRNSLRKHSLSHIATLISPRPFLSAAGASHSRGFPEDPEGGGEEEEEGGEEERDQERPSHIPLSQRAIALHLIEREEQREEEEEEEMRRRVHSQSTRGGLTCRLWWQWRKTKSCRHLYKSQVLEKEREKTSMWHKNVKWRRGFVQIWEKPELL